MDSKRREKRAWSTVALLALSLLLHAALLLLPLPDLERESPRIDNAAIVVDLLPRPDEQAVDNAERPSEQKRAMTEESQRAEEPEFPEREAAAQSRAKQVARAQVDPPVAPAPPDTTATADRMQAQVLSAARALGREAERSGKEKGLQYDSVPDLPSGVGWLNQYTGRVEPSVDRWRSNDGGMNSRIVTASGQVFCTRTPMPTMEQIFNPSMGGAPTMVWPCGRERPEPLDGTDPWIRRPHREGD